MNLRQYSVINFEPSNEAVQEFSVLGAVPPAEYGCTLGTQVDIVTRPGTNQFHRSLYEFSRNDALNANDTFSNRAGIPRALDWLAWWHEDVRVEGFNPFDTLAVGYVTSPDLLQCTEVKARIEIAPDDADQEVASKKKPYLLVSADLKSFRTVTYCSGVRSQLKEELFARLLSQSYRPAATPLPGK